MARFPNFQTSPTSASQWSPDSTRGVPKKPPDNPLPPKEPPLGRPAYYQPPDSRSADDLEKEVEKQKLALALQELGIGVPGDWNSMSLDAAKEYYRREKAKKELEQLRGQSGTNLRRDQLIPTVPGPRTKPV